LAFARTEGIAGDSAIVLGAGMSNGVDATRFAPTDAPSESDGAPVIGFVGRLARDKGVEELACAWHALREEFPSARLLLVGAWEPEDPVDPRWRAALETDERVTLAGVVDDVVSYYRRMSVLAFPSHGSEGFPNAPMEAAAVGLPVVATRVVGCVDAVLDGVTGTLVPPRDATALAAALRVYLHDPMLGRRHGAAGRERVCREFQPEAIWTALHREYLRLLREQAHEARDARRARRSHVTAGS
ncbi:MAG TPA: glycosyltransferase, partial [Gemmatimonadaceae bacterium]|nr:glycosyltransferase [Gemmatimonadaceae bacterium]